MSRRVSVRPEELEEVAEVVFGDLQVNGPLIARAVGAKHVTLWSWLHRTGLPVEVVPALETELRSRAAALVRAANKLRRTAAREQRRSEVAEAEAPVVTPVAAAG